MLRSMARLASEDLKSMIAPIWFAAGQGTLTQVSTPLVIVLESLEDSNITLNAV
jgi:hypothetical protein